MDVNRLADIIGRLDEFMLDGHRAPYLRMLLFGYPETQDRLNSIALQGAPAPVARRLVFSLLGQNGVPIRYAEGKAYLLDLVRTLNASQLMIDYEDREFLATLEGEIQSAIRSPGAALAATGGAKPAGSSPEVKVFLEDVIGEDTLRPIYQLELGLEASKAVCRITRPVGPGIAAGTGFLVSPNCILTNHHVVGSQQDARTVSILFRYQEAAGGGELAAIPTQAKENGLFAKDETLDVTLFELDANSSQKLRDEGVKPVTISTSPVHPGARVAIIQHPSGLFKKISFQNNKVQAVDATTIDYTTTTMGGSSGSPVFDDNFRVVAIHYASVRKTVSQKVAYEANQGRLMRSVVPFLLRSGVVSLSVFEG